jgi:hypothetical protein
MARESKRKREERRFGKPERLADLACQGEWGVPNWCADLLDHDEGFRKSLVEVRVKVLESLGRAKVIVADNVSEYLYANDPKEEWDYLKDFPACAPPFDEFFVEFSRPSRLFSEGVISSTERFPDRWGWLFRSETTEQASLRLKDKTEYAKTRERVAGQLRELHALIDESAIRSALQSSDRESAIERLDARERSFLSLGAQYKAMEAGRDLAEGLPEEWQWIVSATLITSVCGKICVPAETHFSVLKDGFLAIRPLFSTLGGQTILRECEQDYRDTWSAMTFPALLAVSFMNCKKTTLEPIDPDPKLNRERRQAGLKPFLRYHTINIEPMKTVLRSEGNIETEGLKRALHICRGHFATYSEERPLFGRVAGTFWIPAHVRGSAKQGVVISDYDVKPPDAPLSPRRATSL